MYREKVVEILDWRDLIFSEIESNPLEIWEIWLASKIEIFYV